MHINFLHSTFAKFCLKRGSSRILYYAWWCVVVLFYGFGISCECECVDTVKFIKCGFNIGLDDCLELELMNLFRLWGFKSRNICNAWIWNASNGKIIEFSCAWLVLIDIWLDFTTFGSCDGSCTSNASQHRLSFRKDNTVVYQQFSILLFCSISGCLCLMDVG